MTIAVTADFAGIDLQVVGLIVLLGSRRRAAAAIDGRYR